MRRDMRIKCAAILLDGKIWEGRDHGEIRANMAEAGLDRLHVVRNADEGFVTECGRFMRRKPAAYIALNAGQIKKIKYSWGLCSSQLLLEGDQHGKGTKNGRGT